MRSAARVSPNNLRRSFQHVSIYQDLLTRCAQGVCKDIEVRRKGGGSEKAGYRQEELGERELAREVATLSGQ